MTAVYRRRPIKQRPDAANIGPQIVVSAYAFTTKGYEMNHITIHGSITVNGRTVVVHVDDGEATATVDGARFNVRGPWQLCQLLRLLV